MFDSFNDLLFDDQNTSSHSYLYNSNLTTPKSLDIFGLDRTSDSGNFLVVNIFSLKNIYCLIKSQNAINCSLFINIYLLLQPICKVFSLRN